jgi:MYXO-CTERM domain-containing protein
LPFVTMSGNGTLLAGSTLNGAGATSTNNTAFWTGSYNSMQMVAQRGFAPATAPGTAGAVFASNLNFIQKVNNSGQALFNSSLTGGDAVGGTWTASTPTNDSGVWLGGPSGVSLVVREGDAAPSTGGAIFGDINSLSAQSINRNGSVMFKAPLRSGTGAPGGVTTTNNNAAWCNAGGSLALVARASDPVPGLAGVSYGTAVSFYSSTNQDFNNNGRLIYNASLGAGSTSADNEALMTWTVASGASVLYRKGGAAPGAFGGAGDTFATFNGTNPQARLNNNEVIAFAATLQGPGITTSNDETIWTTGIGGSPILIAHEGDAVPGLPGVNFGGAMINASAVTLNNLNEVAFVNTLSDGTVGLFTWDPTTGLSLVLRTTQSGVVPGMGAISSINFSNGGNGDGGSSNFSDTGWLTFNVTDTNGAFAVVRTMAVPAPGALALIGLAGLVTGRRRRH